MSRRGDLYVGGLSWASASGKSGRRTVFRNSVKEIGFRDPAGEWFEMEKTSGGKKDPLLEGIPDRCKVFQLHGQTVGLTSSMSCLARGRSCENQIVKIQDRAYGIQGTSS